MKNILLITTFAGLWLMTACSDGNDQELHPVPETAVRMEGAIDPSTRAVIGSGYEKDLEVCFARQDETGVLSAAYGLWSLCRATRNGGKGNQPILFADQQIYPVDGCNICLYGYYPASDDAVTFDATTGSIVFTVDGETDIMATGRITGNTYDPVKTCTFRHLLTQIQLVCYTDQSDKWGSVIKIEVADIYTKQQLDLLLGTPALAAIVSPGDIKNIVVPDMTEFQIPQLVDEGLPDPQGAVLLPVLPANGTVENPLYLYVTTTRDGYGNEKTTVSKVGISVEGGFQTGKRHVIALLFTDGNRLNATTVGVEAWTNHEEDIPI